MNKQLTIQLTAASPEAFDILAISAGEAKGHALFFDAPTLQASLPLWDGLPVFLDHPGIDRHPSVRDLAGTLTSPAWDADSQGIRLTLVPAGPAAEVLLSLRQAARENPAILQAVGFSAVIHIEHDRDGRVTKILRAHSVDAVIDPARGGTFLRRGAPLRSPINGGSVYPSHHDKGGVLPPPQSKGDNP